MRTLFAVVLVALLVTPTAHSQDKPQYKKMPWHLVDLWWDLGRDIEFNSYSIDVEIAGDVGKDVKLYIAPIGIAQLSEQKFYGGIQTQLGRAYTKTDKNWRGGLGAGGIFSRWGERSMDAIRLAAGGVCESSGYEGDFISVRKPFKWREGKYTYRVTAMDRLVIDDTTYTWVGAFIHDHATGEEHFIGALRFVGQELELDDKVASFVEIYGAAIDPDTIPVLTVTFGNLRVNGEPIEPRRCDAIYPDGVPDYADAKAGPGEGVERSAVIGVGKRIDDRDKRRVKVF